MHLFNHHYYQFWFIIQIYSYPKPEIYSYFLNYIYFKLQVLSNILLMILISSILSTIFTLTITLHVQISNPKFKCQNLTYTYQVLVLKWPAAYCKYNNCKDSSYWRNWDRKSFVVSELRPSSIQNNFSNCLNLNLRDSTCVANFNFKNMGDKMSKKLYEVSPNLISDKNQQFIRNMWNNFGLCYLNIVKSTKKSPYTDQQIFQKYFSTILRIYYEISTKFKFQRAIYLQRPILENDLRISLDKIQIICQENTNNLSEIWLCLSIVDQSPGYETIINCPETNYKIKNRCTHRYPLHIPQLLI